MERVSNDSRGKLDGLSKLSRQLCDQSYGLKIDLQVREREEQAISQEVDILRRRRADIVQ